MTAPLGLAWAAFGELTVFALVGLLGGAHCIGMCGPLVAMYAERMDGAETGTNWNRIRQHVLFNVGRAAGYATLGAAFGLLGLVLFDAAAVSRFGTVTRGVVGIVVGSLIVVAGGARVAGWRGGHGVHVPLVGDAFGRVHRAVSKRIDAWVAGPRIVGLGVVHGFMPCPMLFPAYLYAFGRGSPSRGFLALGVLGLATIPALLAYGTVLGTVTDGNRTALHRALGVAFVLLGYLPLSHGLMLVGLDVPSVHVPVYQPLER